MLSIKELCSIGIVLLEDPKNFKKAIMWMLLDGKGIELLTYVVIVALYITIKIKLRSKVSRFLFYDARNIFL